MAQRENRIADRKQKKLDKKGTSQREKKAQRGWDKYHR